MSVFDIGGNDIALTYDVNGTAPDYIYDIYGNVISGGDPPVIDDIDLSNVAPYFVDDVRAAMAYVKGLGVHGWVHHLVVTDSHYTSNYGNSVPIVEAMQTSGYFGKVIHLGDITDSGLVRDYTKATDEYSRFNGNLLFAIGNHDILFDGYEDYFYNQLLSNDTDIIATAEEMQNFNYYFDDDRHKIRYIVYCYFGSGPTYVQDKLLTTPTGWHVITLCHYNNLIVQKNLVNIIRKDLNYIGNIVGHWHIDDKNTLFDGIYNQILLNNDGMINDDANYKKTSGTVNSQAITIMSIHPLSRTVKFYRIGMPTTLGKTWEYVYTNGGNGEGWQAGYYYTDGALTNYYASCYLSPKKYPMYAESGNALRYTVRANSGVIKEMYIVALDSNGNYLGRRTLSASGGVGTFTASQLPSNTISCLISFDTDGNIETTDDIIVSAQVIH